MMQVQHRTIKGTLIKIQSDPRPPKTSAKKMLAQKRNKKMLRIKMRSRSTNLKDSQASSRLNPEPMRTSRKELMHQKVRKKGMRSY